MNGWHIFAGVAGLGLLALIAAAGLGWLLGTAAEMLQPEDSE